VSTPDVDEFERWQKEIEEVDIQVEGSEFGSLSGNVGRTGVGEDYERPSTGYYIISHFCHGEKLQS